MNALLPLLGRILLALIFVISGYKKIGGFEQTAAYMTSKELPYADVLLVLTIIVELGGGILLILGWKARWAAAAIFLFLIPVSLIFHPFWAVDAAQMQNQFNSFFKNLCIMGGMLYIIAYGAGPLSVDKGR
jgi:putative oxidoreductase